MAHTWLRRLGAVAASPGNADQALRSGAPVLVYPGGHVPPPAKITIEVLPAIDLRERFGPDPDVDEVYEHVVGTMQERLDALAAERRLPIVG